MIDAIERNGLIIYRHDPKASTRISSVDHAAFYQLKTMMQGVLARGTARAISSLSPYVAGKTGTSDDENDAWFVGFSNDVTVAVWIGYDNADGKRRTLGGGATGGGVAVPIFEPVMQAVWANVAPKIVLAPPSPEAKRQLECKVVDLESGEASTGKKRVNECLRIDGKGKVIDTQYRLLSHESKHANHDRDREDIPRQMPVRTYRLDDRARFDQAYDPWRATPQRGFAWDNRQRWQGQRLQPTYFWGGWRQ